MESKREFVRQSMHLAVGLLLVFLIYYDVITPLILLCIILIGALLSFVLTKTEIPLITDILNYVERPEFKKTFPARGPIFMFVGVLLSWELFNKDIALASITILAIGDSISHIAGIRLGRKKNPLNSKKYIEGAILAALVSGIAASFFVRPYEAFVAAFFAMLAESIELDMNKRAVDDNLIVPLVAGTAITLLRRFL